MRAKLSLNLAVISSDCLRDGYKKFPIESVVYTILRDFLCGIIESCAAEAKNWS